MSLVRTFIFATAWAYLACAFYTKLGKPPMIDVAIQVQVAFYLCAFGVFLYVSYYPYIMTLNLLLGVLYGFGAMGSFIGFPQRWSAYWRDDPEKGSAAGQIGMALWDLALAIAFLSLV